ncbi:hypothetical protein MFIFM68171_10636 [Madurella fahalii]|uniref:C2H2-type domain-containing protein n=1 Tax=Madurella fahalii TaxID=1157608 RepID=A0ABQ0GRR1_9PEZI
MSTAAALNLDQVPASDLYDPDEALPKNSPLLEPRRPILRPSPSPAPSLSPVSPPPSPGNKSSNRRRKAKHSQGDAILIGHLDGHRRDTAAYADIEPLYESSDPEQNDGLDDDDPRTDAKHFLDEGTDRDGPSGTGKDAPGSRRMSRGSADREDMGAFDLKSLAAGALAAVTDQPDAGPTPPVTDNDVVGGKTHAGPPAPSMVLTTRRPEPAKEERMVAVAMPSPYSPGSIYSPREPGAAPLSLNMDTKSPTANVPPSSHGEGLPPIQLHSLKFDTNGQTLPSIRAQLGDISQLGNNHAAENERLRHPSFAGSSPAAVPRLSSLHGHHASPPMLPAEGYRDPHSPSLPLASPGLVFYTTPNGMHRPPDYVRSPTELSGSDQSIPASAASITERMSIEGITHTGAYTCKVPGCNAPPFQTQYLLNSHANVHSSARPHYCPVPGCPRSEGGKGFKRKNEMIRHGLVHDSPGYVCPFCPDREHKYPRPDNLQRHVRVHHMDKDKDDPLLRGVLAQRPDGPNRGRRRRGGPS